MPDNQLPLPTEEAVPEPPEWLAREIAFIKHVISTCKQPAAAADLRTGNEPGGLATPWRMMPHLIRALPNHRGQRDVYLTVAAWYAGRANDPRVRKGEELPPAWQPGHGNLGWSVAQAVKRGAVKGVPALQSLESITRQRRNPEVMRNQLRPLVAKLRIKGVPVCWPWLLRDLDRWRHWPVDVTREWMFSYYASDSNTPNHNNNEGM